MKKRVLALILGATMVLGSSLSAMAASSGEVTAAGDLEAYVDTEVVAFVLPTTTATGLKFYMDPQGLLKVSDPSTYTVGEGAVYFYGATTKTQSDDIKFTSTSAVKVDTTLKVEIDAQGVTLVDDAADLTDATTPSLYLGITKNGAGAATALGAETEVTDTLDEIAYQFDKKAADPGTGGYVEGKSGAWYAYIPADPSAKKEVTYSIAGSCDKTADWSGVTSASTIKLTWSVAKHSEDAAPSIATTSYTMAAGTPISITTNFGAGSLAATNISSVKWVDYSNYEIKGTAYCTVSSNTITLTAAAVDAILARPGDQTLKITFDDAAGTVVNVTLKH